MNVMNIFLALLAGWAGGGLTLILDNGLDLGEPDEHTTWFVGPIHVPTLIVGTLAVVALILGWGFSFISGQWVAAGLIALLGAVAGAWVGSFFLPVLNAGLALLGLNVPWNTPQGEGEG